MAFENKAGVRVRVIDSSHDVGLYEVGWEGVLLGCGADITSHASTRPSARVGVRFDPGLQPIGARRSGNEALGDGGGCITTGFRWHVTKDCLELAGPRDYSKYDEGGVV